LSFEKHSKEKTMCPTPETNGANGVNGHNGQNGHTNGDSNGSPTKPARNPYQPVGDFLSNVGRFKIIESTLREGEQFANAFFDTGKFPAMLACAG
jgi:homocitrate synthase